MVYITSQLALTNFLGMGNCSLNTSHLNRVRKSRQAASSSPSSRRPNRSDRQFRVTIRANEFPIITFCHHIFSIFLSAASAGGRKSCASCEANKRPRTFVHPKNRSFIGTLPGHVQQSTRLPTDLFTAAHFCSQRSK